MLSPDDRFRVNDRECAAKVIDGEAVIINLLNGTYYGLDKSGCVIWEMLAGGYSIAETVGGVLARYDVNTDVARADVSRLLQEILAEKILLPADSGTVPDGSLLVDSGAARGTYETPALTTYRDMADLLALDPPMPRLEDIVWSDSGNGR
jgi:hypothetical protein